MLLTFASVLSCGLGGASAPLTLQDTTRQHEPAALHPGSAALVVQLPDIQGMRRAYAGTAFARLLADEDLHQTIGQVMGGPEGPAVDPVQLLMAEYRNLVDTGEAPPFLEMLGSLSAISLSIDVAGGDPIAFFQGMDETRDEDLYASENMAFRLVADFVDAESADEVAAFLRDMLESEAPRNLKLLPYAVKPDGGGGAFGTDSLNVWSFAPAEPGGEMDEFSASIGVVTGGTRIAITAGAVDTGEYLSTLTSGTMDDSSMERFAGGRKAFRKAPNAPVVELYLAPFLERLMLMEAPDFLPTLDLAEALIGPIASMVIRGGHWRIGLTDGQFITEGVHEPGGGGELAGLIGAKPLEASSLTLSHPDALVTSVTSLDPTVLARFVETMASQRGGDVLDEIETAYGFRPDRDIAGALGHAVSYSLPTLKSLLSAPNLMGAAELRDRDAFIRGMDGLLGMAEDAGDDVTVQRKEYKGSMIYTLMFNPRLISLPVEGLPIDPATFFRPTITVMEDRVMFTTLPSHAQKEVRRVAKLVKNNEPLGVHAGITGLGDLAGASTVGYADWPQFFGNLYAQLKSLAPLAAGMMGGGELPFDVNALPEPALLTKHFRPSERWTRHVDGRVLQYSKSSIGPETALLPFVGGVGVFGIRSQQVVQAQQWEEMAVNEAVPVAVVPHEHRPAEAGVGAAEAETRNVLENVAVAVTLYQLDNKGKSPANLSVLLTPTDSYPKGYLDTTEIPTDGWNHALIYATTAEGYVLRSAGKNGVDDNGAGDDITFQ